MYKKSFLHIVTKLLIEIMLYTGIPVCILVPFAVNAVAPYYDDVARIAPLLIMVLLVSGVMSLYILWELRKIFVSLVRTNPFNFSNVYSLRRIAAASFIISVAFLVKCIFWFTLATALIVLIFAIAGLFCLVLADVFNQAVIYKEENDLTV